MDYLYSIANKLSFSYLMYNAIYHFLVNCLNNDYYLLQ
ncbi:hypothetical protein PMCN03_1197 [Pasteurella multocida subsp. multocida str. HB03]|nr:hypothetical protein PMCN03_1197 [Pasteurella multocida subsp. multocida str. HB03]